MTTSKLRFYWSEDHYVIKARRRDTDKWELIVTCHSAAKLAIQSGKTELIQWTK